MSQGKDLAKNTALLGVSKVIASAVIFLLLPIMTSLMTVGEYGVFDLVLSYSGLAMLAIVFNSDKGAFRFLIDARDDDVAKRRIVSSTVAIFLPFMLLVVVGAVAASVYMDNVLICVLGLYFVALAMANTSNQITRGVGRNDVFAISSIVQSLLTAIGILIVILWTDLGLVGIFAGYVVASLVSVVVSMLWSKTFRLISAHAIDDKTRRDILSYSLPLVPSSVSWWVFGAMDRTIISIVLGTSANGIYAVAARFAAIMTTLGVVFEQAWVESASIGVDKKGSDGFFTRVCNQNIRIFGAISMLLMAGTAIVILVAIDDQFAEAYLYVPVLILGSLLNAIVNFYNGVLLAKKETKIIMKTSIAAAAINLVVNLALIWLVGLWAAAISTAIAFGVLAVQRHYYVKSRVKIRYDRGVLVKVFGSFAIVAAVYYIVYVARDYYWLSLLNLAIAMMLSYLLNRAILARISKHGLGILLRNKSS